MAYELEAKIYKNRKGLTYEPERSGNCNAETSTG
jgi:hypothetical protein